MAEWHVLHRSRVRFPPGNQRDFSGVKIKKNFVVVCNYPHGQHTKEHLNPY